MKKIIKRLKNVLRIFWKYKFSIVCIFLFFAIIFSSIHYSQSDKIAGVNVSFNYSEASNGLNPNNTRFNSYEILSEEVLAKAIELVGLQDSLTAQELANYISITPVDTGNASDKADYITTTYAIAVNTKDLKMKNRTAMNLLENICTAYKAYFLENNGDNQEILKLNLEVTKDCEPFLRLNEIKLRAKQLDRYLNARMEENRAFINAETNESFDAFDKRLENIISYDIPNTSAYIIECGVAKNSKTLTEILEYKNKMEQISADKQMENYKADNNGISMYEKLMSSIIMIPTLDEEDQYYMSRTKTAMDKMARAADSELEEATASKKEIVSTNYVIKKMKKSKTGAQKLSSAREMINKLENGLNDLSKELLVFDKSYTEYKAQNYITFNYYNRSFIQRIDIKKTIGELVILGILLTGYLYIRTMRKEKKAK